MIYLWMSCIATVFVTALHFVIVLTQQHNPKLYRSLFNYVKKCILYINAHNVKQAHKAQMHLIVVFGI